MLALTGGARAVGGLLGAACGLGAGSGLPGADKGALSCCAALPEGLAGAGGGTVGALWGGAVPFRDFIEALYAEKVRGRNRIAQCNIRLARLVDSGRI